MKHITALVAALATLPALAHASGCRCVLHARRRLGGLLLGESLGQIGIFVIFIGVLLFRPQGLFGAKA